MRSLTRSMGAAAVFETAAETPPTEARVSKLSFLQRTKRTNQCHEAREAIIALIDAAVDGRMDLLKKSITNGGNPKTASLLSAIVKDLTTYQKQKKILRREWRVRNGLCFWLLFCKLEGEKVLKGRAQEISLVALGPTNSIRPRQPGQT